VRDIMRSVRFYRDQIGFEREWFWGDPPEHAGVAWRRIQVMFSLNPAHAERASGLMQLFRVDDVQGLYTLHRSRSLDIISPLENKPWGLAEYSLRDPDGYVLRFAGSELRAGRAATNNMPPHYQIEVSTPTLDDYERLHAAVDWAKPGDAAVLPAALERSTFCVIATDTRINQVVAMLRVVGDGKAFTIWDVMVDKAHQGQCIGTEMMNCAIAHLRTIASPGTFVGLFSQKPAFYERLGFTMGGGLHLPL
jgi:GNAT superfamily N-acetyltransferase